MRRRFAPPHIIWVLICPDTGGYSYKNGRRVAPPILTICFDEKCLRQSLCESKAMLDDRLLIVG
ncbi:hypothetical protein [Pseudanabaena sp. SR411]|uniref:hypothetical protein n=1 Tax=Pseudanabaena sp. SR411 TaxID=1980935 RepID=UPI0011405DD6|nr:hypothetical protein [Pseudanabaena sp. SR411]